MNFQGLKIKQTMFDSYGSIKHLISRNDIENMKVLYRPRDSVIAESGEVKHRAHSFSSLGIPNICF